MWNCDSNYLQGCLIQFWVSLCEPVSATESNECKRPAYPGIDHSSTDETTALVAELPFVFLQIREIFPSRLVLGGEDNLRTGDKEQHNHSSA